MTSHSEQRCTCGLGVPRLEHHPDCPAYEGRAARLSSNLVAELREEASHGETLIDYAFSEPMVALEAAKVLAISAEIERLTRERDEERAAFVPAYEENDRLRQERDRLRAALTGAVEVIKTWHNMGGNESVWPIYWRRAPEMRPIREALAGAADETS